MFFLLYIHTFFAFTNKYTRYPISPLFPIKKNVFFFNSIDKKCLFLTFVKKKKRLFLTFVKKK